MTTYNYAIAAGSDQTSLTNVEDIVGIAPVGTPIPLGSVVRTTLDQKSYTSGTRIVQWSFKAMSWAHFAAFVAAVWGSFDTENASVTIDTRGRDENFHRGKANAVLPKSGTDYQRREYGNVEDLIVTFRDFQEFSAAFTYGFSLGFEG